MCRLRFGGVLPNSSPSISAPAKPCSYQPAAIITTVAEQLEFAHCVDPFCNSTDSVQLESKTESNHSATVPPHEFTAMQNATWTADEFNTLLKTGHCEIGNTIIRKMNIHGENDQLVIRHVALKIAQKPDSITNFLKVCAGQQDAGCIEVQAGSKAKITIRRKSENIQKCVYKLFRGGSMGKRLVCDIADDCYCVNPSTRSIARKPKHLRLPQLIQPFVGIWLAKRLSLL